MEEPSEEAGAGEAMNRQTQTTIQWPMQWGNDNTIREEDREGDVAAGRLPRRRGAEEEEGRG